MAQCNPYFVRCLKPNNDKCPMKFDMPVVLEQLRYSGMLETIRIRKLGYPVRKKYQAFAEHYRCLIKGRVQRGAPTKEIARYILDQDPNERDNFQLGSTKVFMRESLEQKLESQRLDLFGIAVLKLQRHARGYLARRRFNTMRRNALIIQKTYRGWKVRKEYTTVRSGIVKLQAIYKMKKQKSIYGEMKDEMFRRAENEKRSRELAKERAKRDEVEMERQQLRTVAGVNHLEIPAELAFVFSKLENWTPVNTEKNLAKVSGRIPQVRHNMRLPSDIDYYVFSKVANIYFKSHLWQMRKEPIKTPFLSKSKESDYQESLALFKLILRFMNDGQLSGQKEKILGDYIINKGIRNEKLRDEIYCQLANQTWKNDNEANSERGWLLMANCLSSFPPSKTLYKYLLKYVSDHAYNGYKSVCQAKLLKAARLDHHNSRHFPPTVLEWRANKKRVNMALEVNCYDGETNHVPIESLSSAQSFAARVLKDRGIKECHGWTVALEDGEELVELNGDDFVLDAIGELELPPAFPGNTNPFLVSHDRSRGQIPLTIDTKDGRQYRHSSSPRSSKAQKHQRSKSQDRLLSMPPDEKDFGLSNSALNERYFSEAKSTRSKSLDNLLPNDQNLFGLSESRLNQRYLSQGNQFFGRDDEESIHMESISQRGGKQENWGDIGLSNNPLNDRYFSQPDLDRAHQPRSRRHSEELDASKMPRSNSDRQTKLDNDGIDIDLAQFEYPTERNQTNRRVGNPRFIKSHHAHRRRDGMRSSAMSDTSEAPSLASHVRRVRVPSQASDVDQFLDDLFMPVLDGNIDDGLSDARSLAASMRGGGDHQLNTKSKAASSADSIIEFNRMGSFRRKSVLTQGSDSESDAESDDFSGLKKVSHLISLIKGGSPTPEQNSPRKQSDFTPMTSSAMGFHPIPGVISPHTISGMMSPPPMMMPTPVQSNQFFSMAGGMTSPLLMPATGEQAQPAMAFTYVPVPVYNLGGMGMGMPVNNGMPMMPGMTGMPGMPVNGSMPSMNYSSMGMMNTSTGPSSPNKTEKSENPPSAPAATSTPMSPNASNLSVDSQMAYQHAFLQNAVAQNMQIQQQLMMQNQALSQLLTQTNNVSATSQPKSSMSPKESFSPDPSQSTRSVKQPVPVYFGMNEAQRRASETHLNSGNQSGQVESKPRSKTAPNTPKNSTNLPPQAPMLPSGGPMDAYTRARTVRIGKWRWPPPKEDGEALAEGFFEFKMRKMKHKDDGFDITDMKNESLETSGEIQGLDWGDMNDDFNKGLKRSQSKDSFTIMDDDDGQPREKSESPSNNGNVGKLKISSEMKEKLEAAMGSRKSSVRSSVKSRGALDISKDGDIPEQAVKKLNENRKLILEQKLGGGGKLKKWENIDQELHQRATEENNSSRKSSHDSKGHIPAPPPPPIAPTFTKPLHVDTEPRRSASPGSSYYSPG